MRGSILGFNQQKLIELQSDEIKLDMNDVLLMDYIQKALSQPSMTKIFENEQPYVWLKHIKILQDLPILNIKENMLSKRLSKLVQLDLIRLKTVANSQGRGSRTYYTITETFESLQHSDELTTCKKLHVVEGPDVKNYMCSHGSDVKNYGSDNRLSLDSKLKHSKSKDLECSAPSTSDFNFGKTKEHKPSLYSRCQAHIQAFSNNAGVQSRLKIFLDSLTDMQKLRGERQFVGILNKLKELSADPKTQCKIIDYTIEKGYATFYDSALNNTTAHRACASDLGKHSDALTAKEKAEVRKAQQDGTAEKF